MPGAAAGRQRERRDDALARPRAVQRLGRNETPLEPRAEPDDFAQLIVLDLQRLRLDGAHGDRVGGDLALLVRYPRGAPALGAALQSDERGDDRSAKHAGDRLAIFRAAARRRSGTRRRSRPIDRRRHDFPCALPLPRLPHVLRTDEYFSSSSRIRPVPRTTQVRGSSST